MQIDVVRKRIDELRKQILYYNEQFFTHSRSLISDYAYDQLVNELKMLESNHPDLVTADSPTQKMGESISTHFSTVVHQYPMHSLGNTYSTGELQQFIDRVANLLPNESISFICELKFDGVAINVAYENGRLIHVATRGNGKAGDNITINKKLIAGLPEQIPLHTTDRVEIRGEVVLPIVTFDQLNKELALANKPLMANPRNTASGSLKRLEKGVLPLGALSFLPYGMQGENLPFTTQEEMLIQLQKWGFDVFPSYRSCVTMDDIVAYIDQWRDQRGTLPMKIDGLVIKVNHLAQQRRLGSTAKAPRWAIAYKYKSEGGETQLLQVSYQVGRTGVITPVAHFQPIWLEGTIVKRASLYNSNEIERLGLCIGDYVYVEKGGEIIPKVTQVIVAKRDNNRVPILFPTHCPACDTLLVHQDGGSLFYCPSRIDCPPQRLGALAHFVSRGAMNIQGLGPKTLQQLVHHKLVETAGDIYNLTADELLKLEGFKVRSIERLLRGIVDSRQVPCYRILFALGIRHVGIAMAEELMQHFGTIKRLAIATMEELMELSSVGEQMAKSVFAFFRDPATKKLLDQLEKAGLTLKQEEQNQNKVPQSLANFRFVVSGVFTHFSRTGIKKKIIDHGGKVVGSISAKTDYLVVGNKPGVQKVTQAKQLAVSQIDEAKLIDMIQSTS